LNHHITFYIVPRRKLKFLSIKRLLEEPGIRSLNVDVDVYRGVVYLTGTAKTASQKAKIISLAKSTPRVARVVDYILVMGR
jgi:osmotically-inducible protein OsmY